MPRRSRTGSALVTSSPPTKMRPDVGSTNRLTIRIEVVLPHPDGPTKTAISPGGTSSESSSTATVPSGYRLATRSSRIIGSVVSIADASMSPGGHELARVDGKVDHVARWCQRAGPPLVIGAGRVVGEVEVDDQRSATSGRGDVTAEIGTLDGVEHVTAAAVSLRVAIAQRHPHAAPVRRQPPHVQGADAGQG